MRVPSRCIIALLSTSTFAPCCSTSSSNLPFSSAHQARCRFSARLRERAAGAGGALSEAEKPTPEYDIV